MTQSVLALSMGDYNGIGPEVILKSTRKLNALQAVPIVMGHHSVFEYYNSLLNTGLDIVSVKSVQEAISGAEHNTLAILNCIEESDIRLTPGSADACSGKASMLSVEKGVRSVLSEDCSALVTAPISKKAIAEAGFSHPGHTEFLAELTDQSRFQMILAYESLRVALATIHVPLSRVVSLITEELIQQQVEMLDSALRKDFAIREPRIAMLGVNPHAGDGGVLGTEEESILAPVLKRMNSAGIIIDGPFAADGFFGSGHYKQYDAILAMYHDQGLIPFKTLSFGQGVNVTAGLPIVRTSPDHGTGLDIAGKNRASESSFLAAARLALQLTHNRQESHES